MEKIKFYAQLKNTVNEVQYKKVNLNTLLLREMNTEPLFSLHFWSMFYIQISMILYIF